MSDDVSVRAAAVPDLPDVLNVLDGAMLDVDTGRLRSAIDRGAVLVAVAGGEGGASERILGTLVLDGDEITAVAVRQRRRGQGIGTMLVEAAADRREHLIASFDPHVRPFWETLGFDIGPAGELDRFRGVR